ncbi:MAG TPA: adenylate/guanylate cyclase domain-containing protein [Spirochaetota bacterium]|nr:adenylate/guanylate cyclase domain-containing protein [Spirochaetota bacterium]
MSNTEKPVVRYSIRMKLFSVVSLFITLTIILLASYFIIDKSRMMKAALFSATERELESLSLTAQTSVGIDELALIEKIYDLKNIQAFDYACVLDRDDRVIFCFNRFREYETGDLLNDIERKNPGNGIAVAEYRHPVDESVIIYDFSKKVLPRLGNRPVATVVIGLSDRLINKEIKNTVFTSLIFFIILLVMSLVITFFLAGIFTVPIRALTEGAIRVGKGDLDYSLPITSRDETAHLAYEFNLMTTRFRESLVESERKSKIFRIYTRKTLVNIVDNGEDPTKLIPKDMNLTVLFNDIRDFTRLSENMSPMDVVEMLNTYFDKMNIEIHNNEGEIDKLIGDCIMAGFFSPDNGVKAAVAIQHKVNELNAARKENGETEIRTGTGLNYGPVVAGNIGSDSKMDFTMIGDTVNIASRLESLTKYYSVPIIISESVKERLEGDYKIRFIDRVVVKGKDVPVNIYEVFSSDSIEIQRYKEDTSGLLESAFASSSNMDFEKTIEIYRSLLLNNPDDKTVQFLLGRCKAVMEKFKTGELKADAWDGAYTFMDK